MSVYQTTIAPLSSESSEQRVIETGVKDAGEGGNIKSYVLQYVISVAVSSTILCHSMHMSSLWTHFMFPVTLDPFNPITMWNQGDFFLIDYIVNILTIIGIFCGIISCEKLGRKRTLLLVAVLNFAAVLVGLIHFLTSVYVIAAGVASGILLVAIPVYICEIATPKIRGALGLLTPTMLLLGTLLPEFFMCFFENKWEPNVRNSLSLSVSIMSLIAVFFVPETPYFSVMKDNGSDAEKNLKMLRSTNDVGNELEQLETAWNRERTKPTYNTKINYILLAIGCGLIFAQQFAGLIAVNGYAKLIFTKAAISADLTAIALVAFAICCVIGTSFVIDRFGRKPLLFFSSALSTISLLALGIYFWLSVEYSFLNFLPLMAVFGYVLSFSIGLTSLPLIVTAEIFPTSMRAIGVGIVAIVGSICGFVNLEIYKHADKSPSVFYFVLFAVFCAVYAFLGRRYLPETKQKGLNQLQIDLRRLFGSESEGQMNELNQLNRPN